MSYKNAHKFNYPYAEAWTSWKAVQTKKELYNWHIKFTPWFDTPILEKIVNKEYDMLEKNRLNENNEQNEVESKLEMLSVAQDLLADEKKKLSEENEDLEK